MAVEKIAYQDLKTRGAKELVVLRRGLKKQLHELRMKNAIKSLKETHQISVLRKEIAKINTALTSKSTDK